MEVGEDGVSRSMLILVLLIVIGFAGNGCGCAGEEHERDEGTGTSDGEPIRDLVLYPKGAVGFERRSIPPDTLDAVLGAITPFASLAQWKVVAVEEEENRIRLLDSMKDAYRGMGRDSWARTMDRWKTASVLLGFFLPDSLREFGGVPPDVVKELAMVELGMGVQGLALVARAYGLETHWIASALLIDEVIEEDLEVPEGYDLAFFGMVGFAGEEIPQEFPSLEEMVYRERWGRSR